MIIKYQSCGLKCLELDLKIKIVNLSSIMDEPQTLISWFFYMDYVLLCLIDNSPKSTLAYTCKYIYIYFKFWIKDEI